MRFALVFYSMLVIHICGSAISAEEPAAPKSIEEVFRELEPAPAPPLTDPATPAQLPLDSQVEAITAPTAQPAACPGGTGCNCGTCNCQTPVCSCESCQTCTLCDRIPLLNRFPSDRCFEDFVMPVSNPVWSIDPRSLTYVRGIFINQMIDSQTPVLGAGDLQVYALQLGVALNERLSVIAVKDGYNTLQTRGIGNRTGWSDIGLGLKYVLVRDVENQFLLSGGLIYEATNGSSRVFQGNGDSVWTPYLSIGKQIGCGHLIASTGYHVPGDTAEESQSIYYSVHYDHPVTSKLSALAELNGIVYTKSGQALPLNIEGGDWINLGSSSVAGNNVLTFAFGADYRFNKCLSFAAAWEFPLSNRKDLLDSRTTATLTLMF
ncbi:hypothetical protein [Gimesia chilikensis]|uniref:Uncharacterized protein n=1 Tax=Gimesia chilikensis TaxID=2605989 RepID=A0A517PNM9_9PLAN|nr:hypothetical protein [Gimesia chilikensis]MCR9229663.1 hypothetical protein [bacterium]QDT20981.1 hypothetical protein HG66A1_27730 [Gimesia chilikensis]QDT84627.1 hypothetical protein MalM14_22880 [Gimesia chilikensis]